MYLLDTNTLIYFFKGKGRVAENLLSKSPKEIAVSSIVLFELEVGIAKSDSPAKRRQQLNVLTSVITTIPFTYKEAKTAAIIRAELEKSGTPIGPYDTLIAGTALRADCVLVTNNTKEFSRVENLQLEDWF
ncbi:MAG: type II toxin-antitoxin system tRNA(fMet)-specific endonuclease VapC [Candidatus Electrothrix sp. YB6]